jgi:hypothetical protein
MDSADPGVCVRRVPVVQVGVLESAAAIPAPHQESQIMSLMLGKLYDALRAADGIDDTKAREAAEEVAGYDKDLWQLRMEVRAHSVLLGLITALLIYLLTMMLRLSETVAAIAAKVGV